MALRLWKTNTFFGNIYGLVRVLDIWALHMQVNWQVSSTPCLLWDLGRYLFKNHQFRDGFNALYQLQRPMWLDTEVIEGDTTSRHIAITSLIRLLFQAEYSFDGGLIIAKRVEGCNLCQSLPMNITRAAYILSRATSLGLQVTVAWGHEWRAPK